MRLFLSRFAVMTLCGIWTLGVNAADFATAKDISSGSVSGLSSMDAGDINGDGRVDVLAIEGGLHAGGDKTFAWFEAPVATQGSWIRHDIAHGASLRSFLGAAKLADFDRDGDLDFAVASDNHSGLNKEANVLVFYNPGSGVGTWLHHSVNGTMADHHINDMEVGDLDDDGKLDIVTRSMDPAQIRIFFQNTPTSWTTKTIPTGINESEGLGLGHIDDDGKPDLTFTGFWLDSPAYPRTQGYQKRPIDSQYHVINQNTKEFVYDVDNDGDNDVVIGPAEMYRNGGNNALAWYENPGSGWGSNWVQHIIQSNTNNMHTVKGADMDNDGDIDVVVGKPWNPKEILLFKNNGSGVFGSAIVVTLGKGLYSGILADLGNDSDIDIIGQDIYAKSGKPYIYENLFSPKPDIQEPDAPTGVQVVIEN